MIDAAAKIRDAVDKAAIMGLVLICDQIFNIVKKDSDKKYYSN